MIWKNGISYFLRADQIQVDDVMKVGYLMSRVVRIENHSIASKVAVETEDGTIQANGVLVSGLCDDNQKVYDTIVKVGPYVKNYKSNHFGKDYNTMCIDSSTWKKSYLINNGFEYEL